LKLLAYHPEDPVVRLPQVGNPRSKAYRKPRGFSCHRTNCWIISCYGEVEVRFLLVNKVSFKS